MKNLIFTIFLLALPAIAISQDLDCDTEDNLSKIAKGITYPNCNAPSKIEAYKLRKTDSLCKSCKEEFEMIHGSKITENKNHLQEEFFAAAFNEYKKNLTQNLLTSVKMRSLYSTGVKFNKSVDKCKMKTAADFAKDCSSASAKRLLANPELFKALSREVSNEMAKFLTSETNFDPAKTLLKRTEQKCNIPEKDILLFSASTYEEAFSSEMIEYIKKVDPKKFGTIAELFQSDDFIENFGDASELKISLGTHPLFASHMNSPADFISFVKNIPPPSSTANLRSLLYNKSSGESFDQNMASSCEKSFKALKDSICSNEFETGKIFNDPLNNFGKLPISEKLPIEDQFASTEGLVDNNIKLLELCENKESIDKLNLSKINTQIGQSLDDHQKLQTFEAFKGTKYNSEIGTLTTALCEMTDRTCVAGTLTCSIYQKYKAFNKSENGLSKPADFANAEANELLRSMLGDPTKIDPDTRRILIAEGILPKEDGKFNEKPQIPDSQEQFFAKLPAQKINPGPGPGQTKQNTANLASAGQGRVAPVLDNSYSNNVNNNANSVAPAGDLSDISDLVRGSNEDLKEIQDEIKRRLSALPQGKPANIAEAKKVARDTFKSKGRKITPYQEQALAERMMQPEVSNTFPTPDSLTPNNNRPAVSNTETQLEKWKNGQKDAALMGMDGAQKVLAAGDAGRAPASTGAKPKDLTKVALNIAEDPKVKLSDIFARKIDQNDPETQLLKVLLKNKNNFLLQVKSMNFKIVFDENNNFNVLLESGDRAEAERLRPQLEIFLKRLKS